jgi:alpha-beta hydrolase superfamily lysophospholipase
VRQLSGWGAGGGRQSLRRHAGKIGCAAIDTFLVTDPDGIAITVDAYPVSAPVAVLHVLHGWAEHAGRYARFAGAANEVGIAGDAADHRGQGRSGGDGELGDLGPRGPDGVLDAARAVSVEVFGRHPGLPRLILGHSWGSFILQRYLRRWSSEVDGAVLTGTTYRAPNASPRAGGLNDRFEPAATAYDWLTRDAAEVQKYIDDPWCGFERMASRPASGVPTSPEPDDSLIRRDLPVLILNGADDPIGGAEGGAARADHYREAGLTDVTFTAYPGGRHELLNETNRDEVTADLLAWLVAVARR